MKKILIVFSAMLLVIVACNNSDNKPADADSLNKAPIDTVKIDTVKPTDSIIKG